MTQHDVYPATERWQVTVDEKQTEADLIEQAKAGDVDAFGELFSRHRNMITGYLRILRVPRDEVEDIVQDTFASVFAHIDTFQDRGKGILPFCITVAKNKNSDRLKRVHLKMFSLEHQDSEEAFEIVDDLLNPEERVVSAVTMCDILTSLANSISEQNFLILQRHLDGVPQKEIAKEFNISVGSVKQRLARARVTMRKLLENDLI